MTDIELIKLQKIVLHQVGNKFNEEDIRLSKSVLNLNEGVKELLLKYFMTPFKSNEYFNFYHETDINLNEVYNYVSKIFQDPAAFYEQSVNLARHLYEQSVHPKVKGGEFYVVYLENCLVNGETYDAIGLFKSESKETFLKVSPTPENYSIESEDGININKLDKGCLIFNSENEKGFLVSVVDNLSKSGEARYWMDNFLKVRQREDNFFHTQNVMKCYKDFVTEKLPEKFEVSKADQVDLLNKSMKFFKENEEFQLDTFANEVISQPELIDSFNDYKTNYETEKECHISNDFVISDNAVKKQARVMKSIIKLDKNFHIYIHGTRDNITKGFDEESGMHYYQIFFKEES
jgi:hypothetical protein